RKHNTPHYKWQFECSDQQTWTQEECNQASRQRTNNKLQTPYRENKATLETWQFSSNEKDV
ncbi:MAG: hypothetical protein JAY75_21130, partial [Candidatus Thiodiazotropha taylori]|nr:hypothetical protein [Candidatus Thiodiazotropha taylori]MCW4310723.1 hypothetical protein [Candidatus Thiodiazotropha endolucinida]